jgi:hypothetical protein
LYALRDCKHKHPESTALICCGGNGVKGGVDAGTALRNVLLKLSAPDAIESQMPEAVWGFSDLIHPNRSKNVWKH